MKTCVFPGSFDPVTLGHMDLIKRAAGLFDRVTVTVMVNVHKRGALDADTRVKLLEKACAGLENVHVDRWEGLLAEYMRRQGETCVIRGIRTTTEMEQELTSARINQLLNPSVETVFLPASEGLNCVSSSAVRELMAFGGNPEPFLPPEVGKEIRNLLSKKI